MTYKKLPYILGAFCLLASCTDDTLLKNDTTKFKGKEVHFGVSADNIKDTRTFYDYDNFKEGDTSYALKWASDDRIVVATPMGEAGNNNKVYDINVAKPGSPDAVAATSITPNTTINPVGIQWGENNNQKGSFYSIYPYRAETRRRPTDLSTKDIYHNKITLDANGNATATVLVDPNQRIWRNPFTDVEITHNASDAPQPMLWQMYGSNHSNVMWAQTDNVTYGDSVSLRFKPLSTCLMLTFTNPSGTASDVDAMIEDIKIIAPTGTNIAGPMQITFPTSEVSKDGKQGPNTTNLFEKNEDNSFKYFSALSSYTDENGNVWKPSNQIEIWPWIRSNEYQSGIHPILRPGDTMQVCAFMLPTFSGNITNDWKVQVTVNNKVYNCSLVHDTKAVVPGQIHKITLPPFDNLTEWTFNPASWMEDIDNSVYLNQITFPGAWYSYSQDQSSKENYQALNLAQQLKVGIRAFDFSTRCSVADIGSQNQAPDDVVISGTGTNGTGDTGVAYYRGGTSIGNAINTIAQYIGQTNETAMVSISYETGGKGGHRPIDYQYWLYGLNNIIKSCVEQNGNYIYQTKVDENTTLGQVRGKIILKINVDDDIISNSSSFPYESGIPALMSYTPSKWLSSAKTSTGEAPNLDETSLTSSLYWSEWKQSYVPIIIGPTAPGRKNQFVINFSYTNRTYYRESTELMVNSMPTLASRQNALTVLFNEAESVYSLNYHDELFLFGAGGVLAQYLDKNGDSSSGSNTGSWLNPIYPGDPNPLTFAEQMNPWILNKIQNLFDTNKPTPLGMFFINQVGNPNPDIVTDVVKNDTYKGDQIVNLLIKLNDAFYLQRNPDYVDPTTKTSIQSAAPNAASGFHADTSSNNWSVF